ncbi:hypothetical protein Q4Q34_15260 [Flavivirga abyssicola]|uniref:hypothetical protein n=1 Tax=Flavivirga abyssicola TaxID=3063533 RepID=UPI0026DF1F7D|nr:hypothetical protein [Flavivirga sp. MEBiC07777]WVK12574.1 hypothetical protein Q4Q34_15260 [Flavivirga sp. MEBiC07777]
MEKSIESIWEQGFLNKEALIVPKLNNLYEKKSISLVEKYKRMFNKNMMLLSLASIILLVFTLLIGMPFMGIPMFVILNVMVLIDKTFANKLNQIDNTKTCYHYLKKVKTWMDHKTSVNSMLARVLYPYMFISMFLGYWYFDLNGTIIGKRVVYLLSEYYPNIALVFGFPLCILLVVFVVAIALSYLGKSIYLWDLKLGYGNILKRINDLLSDIEELRN